jgi:hypothetical protein
LSDQDWKETPLAAKAALGFFFLLWIGVGLFIFTMYCKYISASPMQIVSIALLVGCIFSMAYFAHPFSINGKTLDRKLTVIEKILAVVALISFCAGLFLSCLY